MTEKTILLIGRSGRGKSTLANVILNKNENFEEIFKESSSSISETKKIQFEEFKENDVNYLVIDTPGIGDTKMSDNEVLDIIGEAVYLVRNGLDQVLFVVGGRFDQYEMATYNLLRTMLFDEKIVEHTTIVRTRFADFRSKAKREEDVNSMIKESKEKKVELENQIANKEKEIENLSPNSEEYKRVAIEIEQLKKELKSTLSEIIESCQSRIVHVDNKPDVKIRGKSRVKLLEHLNKTCQENSYKPDKLKELSDAITEDMDTLLKSRRELDKEMKKLKINQPISINVKLSENKDELENITERINKIELAVEEQEIISEGHLAVGKIKELEDKKDKLRKEIAEKEKIIRQKVLKHIFENYQEVKGELGGDKLMESVVDDKKLTAENKELLAHISNIEQLRNEYVQQLKGEVDALNKHNEQFEKKD
ncbi:5241_t:CDS:2 [Cetraspora pellucida]|uniref:5241_t:CDS:1 n=1 Tax=Cetraspora pellucida TaxID=1433469 RepID=A0ACA9MBD6_9GLOM|nr:5241_t:CDS:2 [Cetraspora pellucida]